MKLIFARIICLNAVILLTSGILFGAIDLQSSVSTSSKKIHYSSNTDLSLDSFSFLEEEEEEDALNLTFLVDYNYKTQLTKNKKLDNLNKFTSKYFINVTNKTPIWIIQRHIII